MGNLEGDDEVDKLAGQATGCTTFPEGNATCLAQHHKFHTDVFIAVPTFLA